MAGGQQLPEQYTVPQYARIFHSLPHLNVSLHSVNNTFNPHSEIYLEVGMVLPDIEILNLTFSPQFYYRGFPLEYPFTPIFKRRPVREPISLI